MIQAIRGMNDTLPQDIPVWNHIENNLKKIFLNYGYQEIRFPVLEKAELFQRSIGEATDIIEKEMYVFLDKNNESLALRPEGTAGCVRACIEHGLLYNQTQKLWYSGPVYRYERPQKGRYRQFYTVGVEAFGFSGYLIEAEMILLSARLWQALNISHTLTLQINSLGTLESRMKYRKDFVRFCENHYDQLDSDSQNRLIKNPLRILDSKNIQTQALLKQAPQLTQYLDAETQQEFNYFCEFLTQQNIHYIINPCLVRGLDYYTGTVFEWVSTALGAQGTVCAGGRYDGLVKQLGGQDTPAVGFGIGLERVMALYLNQDPDQNLRHKNYPDISIIASPHKKTENKAYDLTEKIRTMYPDCKIIFEPNLTSFKSQFKRAHKLGARFACIIGEDELAQNMISFKNLQNSHQVQLNPDELMTYLGSLL